MSHAIRVCALLLGLAVTAATAFAAPNLQGTWQAKDGPVVMVLTLDGNGSGTLEGAPFRYTVKGSTLVVDEGGEVNNYAFSLKGNALTLSGGDLDRPMTFQRQGGAPQAAEKGSAPPPTPAKAEPPGKARGGAGIVGLWQGPNGAVDIRANGTIVIANESYPYTATGSVITVTLKEGPLQVPYQL